jgi:hypothetical protein
MYIDEARGSHGAARRRALTGVAEVASQVFEIPGGSLTDIQH